jgi:hypothetical protein
MTDNINKLFFQNINGLIRIFDIKNINFKLVITPINNLNHKITYHFNDNILKFPNTIQEIIIKFKYLIKNLSYVSSSNDLINFNLEICDTINKNIKIFSEIIIHFKEILNVDKKFFIKNNISDQAIDDFMELIFNYECENDECDNDEHDNDEHDNDEHDRNERDNNEHDRNERDNNERDNNETINNESINNETINNEPINNETYK